MNNDAPIGIFDSGVGGLTVAKEVISLLPNESIIYVGDDGRFPYGPRPREEVREFACEISDFLLSQGVKMIVVACNTVSSQAMDLLVPRYPIPVLGVIEDTALYAAPLSLKKRIGVLATPGTVNSNAYPQAFSRIDPQIKVVQVASQALVNLIENGSGGENGVKDFASKVISPFRELGVDVLILGCTHYPYLTKLMGELLGDQAQIVDPAVAVSLRVKRELTERKVLSEGNDPRRIFYTTGNPTLFLKVGSRIFPGLDSVESLKLK
ncbi:MAG: glutamate racemase [Caldiserica bacterium]|jgi:glutamate racemase|nr:glutamate racemase [Caldisericota bacterium]MDH7562515.1 glutamate racemase [Caldisericota bacterium]